MLPSATHPCQPAHPHIQGARAPAFAPAPWGQAADACVTIYRFCTCYCTRVLHILSSVGISGSILQKREQSLELSNEPGISGAVLESKYFRFPLSSFLIDHLFLYHESCVLRLLPFSCQMLPEDSLVLGKPAHSELSVRVDTGRHWQSAWVCPWQQVAVPIQPTRSCGLRAPCSGAGAAAGGRERQLGEPIALNVLHGPQDSGFSP